MAQPNSLGARAARGELLLFIDADVAVAPGTIAAIVETFQHDPSLAALFGSYDTRPPASNVLSQYKNLFHHFVHQTSHARATTFWSGCGAVRRTVFRDVGGFSTAFGRPAIEDIDFGMRLTRWGHEVRLCHDLQVTHLKRWTARSLVRTDMRDRGMPWVQLLLRERALTLDLNLQTAGIASVVCVWLLWAALLALPWWSAAGAIVLVNMLLLFAMNLPLYQFFARKRGAPFALATLPWHWLSCTYSGLCVVPGIVAHVRSQRTTPDRVFAGHRPQEISSDTSVERSA